MHSARSAAISTRLTALLGADRVQTWDDLSASWQGSLGGAIASKDPGPCMVFPKTEAELAEVVTCAHQDQWRILPCGRGSKLSWGSILPDIDLVVSTLELSSIIDHAAGDLTLTAEAGIAFAALQTQVAGQNQFVALDPTYAGEASLGGIVATADSGSLRHRYGGVRDQVLGIRFVRSDGQVAKAGGRVVKNVAGYDLMKLFTGSYGSLGILTQITLRLYPLPDRFSTMVMVGEPEALAQLSANLLSSALTPIAADLLSRAVVARLEDLGVDLGSDSGSGLGLAVRFGTVAAGVTEQIEQMEKIAAPFPLTIHTFTASDSDSDNSQENLFWQHLSQVMGMDRSPDRSPHSPELNPSEPKQGSTPPLSSTTILPTIFCKTGILPTQAIALLQWLDRPEYQQAGLGRIRLGSGLGWLRFEGTFVRSVMLEKLRSFCQSHSGFLTLLEAPPRLKQQVEAWGYQGNALALMQKLKQEFDPQNTLKPQGFVGRI